MVAEKAVDVLGHFLRHAQITIECSGTDRWTEIWRFRQSGIVADKLLMFLGLFFASHAQNHLRMLCSQVVGP